VLAPRHAAYLVEAQRLQTKYAAQIHLLVGFEAEWIRPAYAALVRELAAPACVDSFVGSVHHAAGVPIDFDRPTYARAVQACGGTEAAAYALYYDDQLAMLRALRPRVVGHFDLVRLLSDEPGRALRAWADGAVWAKVVRNLEFVAGYGGWLECNTAALRKGLAEPYPSREISEVSVLRVCRGERLGLWSSPRKRNCWAC
jgi:histidinol-phosphatase (PHP family)